MMTKEQIQMLSLPEMVPLIMEAHAVNDLEFLQALTDDVTRRIAELTDEHLLKLLHKALTNEVERGQRSWSFTWLLREAAKRFPASEPRFTQKGIDKESKRE